MKTYFVFFILALSTFSLFAQPDTEEKKSIKIPAIETKEKDSTKKLIIKPNSKIGITKPKTNSLGIPTESKYSIKKKQKEFSMIDDNGLRNPGELFEKRFNKIAVEQGLKIETMADVFLGDIRSNGRFVNIVCRDHEYPDGDLVRVYVNGDIIVPSLLLTSGYKGFNVDLSVGINNIVFEALNQGDSGPNTAEFLVYDDKGILVSSKKWNLLTGVKATVNVIKDEFPIQEKTKSDTANPDHKEN
ncbi:hypothetical protein [Psychroserpens algicola]|uniref:Secreted protein n=1 Tax=Psychroserpens algicola TaxID=1719034 RepID=A0ABT0H8W4_9FLAO|nr:hypothetical protein [Psychroserpens algicola]MCK8480627.1 hypothetical protein [Psychroserpens algicola]